MSSPTGPALQAKEARTRRRLSVIENASEAHRLLAPGGAHESPPSSWTPINLAAALDAGPLPPPELLGRTDGRSLLYAGRIHGVHGEPESGKSWLALAAVREVLEAGKSAVFVDFEDEASTVVQRLSAIGVPRVSILDHFTYIRPADAWDDGARRSLHAVLQTRRPALVVLDGATEAYALLGLNPDVATDVAQFVRELLRPAAQHGAAVLTIDHVIKSREGRGRWAIGSQHKLAALDVSYSLEAKTPFAVGRSGESELRVVKDRPGRIREFADDRSAVARLRLAPSDACPLVLEIHPPADAVPRDDSVRDHVLAVIEANPGIDSTGLRDAVPGRYEETAQAVKALVGQGTVEQRKVGRRTEHHLAPSQP